MQIYSNYIIMNDLQKINSEILELCSKEANDLWMSVQVFSDRVFRLLNMEWKTAINNKTKINIAITAVSNTYKRTTNYR